MSIHKNLIETLLDTYTNAHARGAHHASGSLLPEIVRALVALVEERTGGASVEINHDGVSINTAGSLTVTADKISIQGDVSTENSYNPLALMEDYFAAGQDSVRAGAAEVVAATSTPEVEPVTDDELVTETVEEPTEDPKADEPATDDAPTDESAPKTPKRGARSKA